MDHLTLGVMIPIVAIVGGIAVALMGMWTSHKQKLFKLQADAAVQATAEKAAQYAASNQQLEDRVRVIERIVTDKGYDVATQIEALRDQRRVEERLDAAEPAQREKA